jgi:thymidylate synthase (FAD)
VEVKLIGSTEDPVKTLYMAFRVCYSATEPSTVLEMINNEKITRDQMMEFLEKRLETGHTSPLRQIDFEFIISGVSRALTHQLVRHTVGWNFEQQSQRYVKFNKKGVDIVVPDSIVKAGEEQSFIEHNQQTAKYYAYLIGKGVPAEDARFVLPNAATSNIKLTVNLLALQHFLDVRLCTRAQWEIRYLATKMRIEVFKQYPWMAKYLGIKCEANRMGYCDEDYEAYQKCPLSKIRPHKKEVIPK